MIFWIKNLGLSEKKYDSGLFEEKYDSGWGRDQLRIIRIENSPRFTTLFVMRQRKENCCQQSIFIGLTGYFWISWKLYFWVNFYCFMQILVNIRKFELSKMMIIWLFEILARDSRRVNKGVNSHCAELHFTAFFTAF